MILIDTDVIIWYMRGNQNASKALQKHRGFAISVITYMELVQSGQRITKPTLFPQGGISGSASRHEIARLVLLFIPLLGVIDHLTGYCTHVIFHDKPRF